MSHLQEVFPILENGSTGAGEAPTSSASGDASAGKKGLVAFGFKDSAGNLVLPQLTSEGKLAVDFEGAGISKASSAATEVAGSATLVTVAEVALTSGKTYGKIHANGSCFREAIFYVYQQDDTTNTLIGAGLTGAGCFNAEIDLGMKEVVAGAAGTQKLILKAKCLNATKLSDFLGDVSCLEFAV